MRPTRTSISFRLAIALTTVAGSSFVATRDAAAQEVCDPDAGTLPPNFGTLIATFPGDRSTNVPTDGFIRLRYGVRAPLRPFVIVQNLTTRTPVMGHVNALVDEVHWQSDEMLPSNTIFRVSVSDASGGAGENVFTFTTGGARSGSAAPTFGGVQAAETQRSGMADPCGQPDAVEVTLSWRRGSAAGWPDSEVEYVIYETRGPGISGPVERGRERALAGAGSTCNGTYDFCRAIRLSPENSSAPVCFNVQAVDPYGRQDGNTLEVCTDPSRGNNFNGCAVARATGAMPSHPKRGWIVVAILAAAASVVATRRRG